MKRLLQEDTMETVAYLNEDILQKIVIPFLLPLNGFYNHEWIHNSWKSMVSFMSTCKTLHKTLPEMLAKAELFIKDEIQFLQTIELSKKITDKNIIKSVPNVVSTTFQTFISTAQEITVEYEYHALEISKFQELWNGALRRDSILKIPLNSKFKLDLYFYLKIGQQSAPKKSRNYNKELHFFTERNYHNDLELSTSKLRSYVTNFMMTTTPDFAKAIELIPLLEKGDIQTTQVVLVSGSVFDSPHSDYNCFKRYIGVYKILNKERREKNQLFLKNPVLGPDHSKSKNGIDYVIEEFRILELTWNLFVLQQKNDLRIHLDTNVIF